MLLEGGLLPCTAHVIGRLLSVDEELLYHLLLIHLRRQLSPSVFIEDDFVVSHRDGLSVSAIFRSEGLRLLPINHCGLAPRTVELG